MAPEIDPTIESADACWARMLSLVPSKHCATPLTGVRKELYAPGASGSYLEIGCRLGHSLGMALAHNDRRAVVVDAWIPYYADEGNFGTAQVQDNLAAWGIDWNRVMFLSGDSHRILPLLRGLFDLILVDGDHTVDGARKDLEEALRVLASGGTLLFDDAIPELLAVWQSRVPAHLWKADQRDGIPYRKAVAW